MHPARVIAGSMSYEPELLRKPSSTFAKHEVAAVLEKELQLSHPAHARLSMACLGPVHVRLSYSSNAPACTPVKVSKLDLQRMRYAVRTSNKLMNGVCLQPDTQKQCCCCLHQKWTRTTPFMDMAGCSMLASLFDILQFIPNHEGRHWAQGMPDHPLKIAAVLLVLLSPITPILPD